MAKGSIFDDSRYPAFVERYHADALRFAVEVCGMAPSEDQEDLLIAMSAPTAKVSVVSGTGTGKTSAFGRIALWSLLCHPYAVYEGKVEIGSNTYIGAPLVQQVGDGVWKEMQDARLALCNGEHAWIDQYFSITKTAVVVKGFEDQWYIKQIALAKGQSVGVAGKHRYWQLIIIDEAAGVPDDHFKVIDGTQTQGGNRTLIASQGVRPSGKFYETQHKLSHKNITNGQPGEWLALRFNSENSPFVETKWLRARELETGGRDSVEYQIRVLGLFPDLSDRFLIGRAPIERMIGSAPVIRPGEAYGHMIVIDVAAGVYRDKTVALHVKVVGDGDRLDHDPRRADVVDIPIFSNSLDWQEVCGRLVEYSRHLSNVTYVVDIGGQGEQFARMMENLGLANIIRVQWGVKSFHMKNQARFFSQRAQCSVHAREAVQDGRITFITKHRDTLVDQGSRIPYFFDEKARYHILPKDKMAEEGIPSPDLWDTVCMVFLDVAHYIPASDHAIMIGDERQQIADSLTDSIAASLGLE